MRGLQLLAVSALMVSSVGCARLPTTQAVAGDHMTAPRASVDFNTGTNTNSGNVTQANNAAVTAGIGGTVNIQQSNLGIGGANQQFGFGNQLSSGAPRRYDGGYGSSSVDFNKGTNTNSGNVTQANNAAVTAGIGGTVNIRQSNVGIGGANQQFGFGNRLSLGRPAHP